MHEASANIGHVIIVPVILYLFMGSVLAVGYAVNKFVTMYSK